MLVKKKKKVCELDEYRTDHKTVVWFVLLYLKNGPPAQPKCKAHKRIRLDLQHTPNKINGDNDALCTTESNTSLPPVTSLQQHPESQAVRFEMNTYSNFAVVHLTTFSLETRPQYKVQTPKVLDSDEFSIDLALYSRTIGFKNETMSGVKVLNFSFNGVRGCF